MDVSNTLWADFFFKVSSSILKPITIFAINMCIADRKSRIDIGIGTCQQNATNATYLTLQIPWKTKYVKYLL